MSKAMALPLPARSKIERRVWRELRAAKMRLWDRRRRYRRLVIEHLGDMPLLVLPDVFNPTLLRSGEFLVRTLQQRNLLRRGSRMLDLGCGSGAVGIAGALSGCEVVAVDVNPEAVRCTRINALLNDVAVDARHGDLFEPVPNERFDVIAFNPPYYRGVPRDALDHAWRSPDVAERFSANVAAHLADDGYAVLVLSSDGEPEAFLGSLEAHGFRVTAVAQRDFGNEIMTVYCAC